jgi:hypothetical protein
LISFTIITPNRQYLNVISSERNRDAKSEAMDIKESFHCVALNDDAYSASLRQEKILCRAAATELLFSFLFLLFAYVA